MRNTITTARAAAVLGAGALVLAACQGPAATSATTSATRHPALAGAPAAGSGVPTGGQATVPSTATVPPPASTDGSSTLDDPSTDEDLATLQSALAGLDADLSQSATDLTDTQGDS